MTASYYGQGVDQGAEDALMAELEAEEDEDDVDTPAEMQRAAGKTISNMSEITTLMTYDKTLLQEMEPKNVIPDSPFSVFVTVGKCGFLFFLFLLLAFFVVLPSTEKMGTVKSQTLVVDKNDQFSVGLNRAVLPVHYFAMLNATQVRQHIDCNIRDNFADVPVCVKLNCMKELNE